MTVRERFQKVFNGDPNLDRGPVIEWAAWWDKTIRCWEKEGMPKNLDRYELYSYFNLDDHYLFGVRAIENECPRRQTSNMVPIIIENEEDYMRVKKYLYPQDAVERLKENLLKHIPKHESGECPMWYALRGFFWHPRELFGDEAHLYAFYDQPELYHKICEDLVTWQIEQVHALGQYFKADFMSLSEDMSYNNGPMISKEHFDEFMLPYYKRLIAEIHKYGTKVLVDSDGNVEKMLPWLIEAGVDGIFPLERQAGVDLVKYREMYPDFIFMGGFDKMSLLKGKEAIKAEFDRLLPVIESGKYIPSMDHQTPPGTTIENYKYYVQLLTEYSQRACKGRI